MNNNYILNEYSETRDCLYKGEYYTVRDNGAIYRHAHNESKPRKLDKQWTFGKKNQKTGYMMFGSNRVHIIVATAFIGCHDSKKDVVDHIDTNRCNNRSENLRWVTKLENALNNPITRKRIEYLCGGDINKFIEDPSCLQDITGNYQNVMWMRTVSKEEAKATYQRVMEWTQKQNNTSNKNVGIGEWIFETPYQQKEYLQEAQNLLPAMLPITAMQRNWKTPTEFPLCPSEIDNKSLISYLNNRVSGFFRLRPLPIITNRAWTTYT